MTQQIDAEVKALLDSRRGDWLEIAAGSQVSYSWLSKFANGRIPNPGIVTLRKLHAYLRPVRKAKSAPEAA